MSYNHKLKILPLIVIFLLIIECLLVDKTSIALAASSSTTVYEQRIIHSPDGIGKYYMGREIAKVMGYTGAGWLERQSREVEEQPGKIVSLLNLKSNDVVADIGAGTGYLSFRIAPLLTDGKVLAVDVQPEMLEIIELFEKYHQC